MLSIWATGGRLCRHGRTTSPNSKIGTAPVRRMPHGALVGLQSKVDSIWIDVVDLNMKSVVRNTKGETDRESGEWGTCGLGACQRPGNGNRSSPYCRKVRHSTRLRPRVPKQPRVRSGMRAMTRHLPVPTGC